jgi:hypothetical protein
VLRGRLRTSWPARGIRGGSMGGWVLRRGLGDASEVCAIRGFGE